MKRRTGLIVFFVTAFLGIVVMSIASSLRPKRGPLAAGTVIDYLLIEKKAHRLTLFSQHRRLRSYKIALGRGGLGPKLKAGDAKTPEGLYRVERHLARGKYPYALKIDFPSEKDLAMARRRGARTGGEIFIHGMRSGFGWIGAWHRLIDWTSGSIAMTDAEMSELYHAVPDETPVEIRG